MIPIPGSVIRVNFSTVCPALLRDGGTAYLLQQFCEIRIASPYLPPGPLNARRLRASRDRLCDYALQAPRKPGSSYQIVERYPGVRLYIGLPE
jgi:hypothetical protein